jgi:N-acetyl sugar amidotransferase
MNPLLVSYNKQYNTAVGVRNLANLRIKFNCDILVQTCNPETVKKITRATLRRFGSIYWHCIAGQTVFPVQVATKFKIPLIIWGAHQGLDQVGMFSHLDEVEMTRKYRKEHDLMGYEAEDLISDFDEINEKNITPFSYPGNREIEAVGVRGIYLNNYIRWDSKAQHEQMIEQFDYETLPSTRTFDVYNDIDCWNYSDLHDHIKYIKHGYGIALDHACRDIRLGHITRNQGAALVKHFSSKPIKNLNLFLNWIGMTENSFNYILDQHRNNNIWSRSKDWEWIMHDDVGMKGSSYKTEVAVDINKYKTTLKKFSHDKDDKYILIGKGL